MEEDLVQRRDFLVRKRKALEEFKKVEHEEKLREEWRVSYAVCIISG